MVHLVFVTTHRLVLQCLVPLIHVLHVYLQCTCSRTFRAVIATYECVKNNRGNSLSKCQLVKTMSKARVRKIHVMGKNEWFCSLPFHWHFGNILSLFFHTFGMLLFLWGYCFIITTISILLLIHDD